MRSQSKPGRCLRLIHIKKVMSQPKRHAPAVTSYRVMPGERERERERVRVFWKGQRTHHESKWSLFAFCCIWRVGAESELIALITM